MSLINYNGESKVISRICDLLNTMSGVNFEVVNTLPTQDISTSTIYLVPKQTAQTENIYDEYINTDGTSQGWELIGTTEIDLTNYVQFSDLSTVATSGDYDDLIDKPTIPTTLSQLSDDSTHRLVTDTEKSTWNGKAELEDIDKAETDTWNLVRTPYYETSKDYRGITWTVNGNTVTAYGTATNNSTFVFRSYLEYKTLPKSNVYRLSGSASGGSSSTYYTVVQFVDINGTALGYAWDYGDGVDFTPMPDTAYIGVIAYVRTGVSIPQANPITFEPKIVPVEKVDWVSNGILGVKNLIPYPWYHTSGRVNMGITFSFDEEGYIALNGTADASNQPFFELIESQPNNIARLKLISGKKYKLTIDRTDDRIWSIIYIRNSSGSSVSVASQAVYEDGTVRTLTSDYISLNYSGVIHSSVIFEITTSGEYYIQLDLRVNNNSGSYSSDTDKARVMLRFAEDTDDTWQPYAKTNQELTTDKHEQYLADILGVKNLLPFPYYHPNYEESYVVRAVTYTQSNGVISVSGTCDNTGNSYCQVIRYVGQNSTPRYRTRIFRLKAGKYKLTGGVSSNVYLTLSYYTDTSSTNPTRTTVGNDYGDGVVFNVTETQAETNYFTLFVIVKKGYQTQGETLKPMLRFANDTDESYMPFSLTNQELTEEVSEKRLVDENLNDIINSGFYLGSSENTVTNKPTGVAQFGLMVVKTGESGIYVKQALTTYSGTEYVRYCNAGTWGNWTQI